jgi:hypothetical protein
MVIVVRYLRFIMRNTMIIIIQIEIKVKFK